MKLAAAIQCEKGETRPKNIVFYNHVVSVSGLQGAILSCAVPKYLSTAHDRVCDLSPCSFLIFKIHLFFKKEKMQLIKPDKKKKKSLCY